ncbi:MAG: hypothetical protein ABMA14_19025 [Hyphomonadaceae bacterium]
MTQRALVMGGGGTLGVAWETGLLAGLESEGVSLGGADLILGTSADRLSAVRLRAAYLPT